MGRGKQRKILWGMAVLRGFSDCSQAVLWVEVLFPAPLERAGTLASPPGPYFFEEIGERTPRGRRFLPLGTPFSGGGMGEGGYFGRGLACGLQDQRLMARPPARAGGRSGFIVERKNGNPNGYFLPSPKGYLSTSPARPAGGRAVTGLSLGGPQARYPVRGTASPTPTREGQREEPHQKGPGGPTAWEEPLPKNKESDIINPEGKSTGP